MSHFNARYAGRCTSCGTPFEIGAALFYTDDDALAGQECCGGEEEPRTAPLDVVPADRVMPRGRVAGDRCSRCFQIPASNGVCGCD